MYSAFIAISRCPAGSEGKPIQDQRKENGNAEAHPLARGEHSDRTMQNDLQQGSSPLARGTHRGTLGGQARIRLIPARAGTTLPNGVWYNARGAHPRSRGDHRNVVLVGGRFQGSSPLARGTPLDNSSHIHYRGLIPARAGNTRPQEEDGAMTRAHPRSRGEHSMPMSAYRVVRGSSPLARGTRAILTGYQNSSRLIPARAGNTRFPIAQRPLSWAHPRSRGEHLGIDNTEYFIEGSSPLARGTRHASTSEAARSGLIPARAGNT